MIPKPTYRPHKSPKSIPAKIRAAVHERDGHVCQKSGERGTEIHHIVPGGMGRRRVHTIENLITLSLEMHDWAENTEEGRRWCEDWSRERYGNIVDLIKRYGHEWEKYCG